MHGLRTDSPLFVIPSGSSNNNHHNSLHVLFDVDFFLEKTKRGTSNNLKVVHSGTKEFKIGSNKRDLFLGFSEHQERLHKKLALEEGRIFAANEQLC